MASRPSSGESRHLNDFPILRPPTPGAQEEQIRTTREFFGVLWIGGDQGLAMFDGQWRRWSVRNGLSASRVAALDMDPVSRDLWIGTLGGGLARLTAGRLDVFDQFNSGLAGDLVFGVAVHNGRVLAATNGGVSAFECGSESWDLLIPRRSDESQMVATDLIVQGDKLLARMWPGGVFRWDGDSRTWLSEGGAERDVKPLFSRGRQGSSHGLPESSLPAVAIVGPGTRRIALPGDDAPGQSSACRDQPDPVAARVAVAKALESRKSEVVLWQPAPGYARYGWGLLEDDVVSYADRPEVLGLVAHLGERQRYTAASIAQFDLPTVNMATDPLDDGMSDTEGRWIFRCRGSEPMHFHALLDHVRSTIPQARWAVVSSATARDSRVRTAWTRSYERQLNLRGVRYVELAPGQASLDSASQSIAEQPTDVVVIWGDAVSAVGLMERLRGGRLQPVIVGGPELVGDEVLKCATQNRWSVIALAAQQPAGDCPADLPARYASLKGAPAGRNDLDPAACRTFHATDHLLSAVESAPTSRGAVARSLLRMEEDIFGERHHRSTEAPLNTSVARVVDGQWMYEVLPAPSAMTGGAQH